MGKSCCKLIAHTCKSSITIRSKVNQLYLLQNGTNEEFHANLQAQKLMKYLDDRKDKIHSCVKLIDKRCKTALEGEISREDMRVLNITLHALKHLSYLKEFLLLTNSLCFQLLSQSAFSDSHNLVIEVLEESTNKYPDDSVPYAEKILVCLLRYSDNKPHALLMGKLAYAIGDEIKDTTWDKVLELAFQWALQGDLELFKYLATFMYDDPKNYEKVIQLFSNHKWKEPSLNIFLNVLGNTNRLSDFVYSMILHLKLLITQNRLIENPCKCLLILLQEAQSQLQGDLSMQAFREVLETIMNSISFELAQAILLQWCEKADPIGVFLLIKEFLTGESIEKTQKQCLKILIEFIDSHRIKSVPFVDRMLGFIDELLTSLLHTKDLTYIKYIGTFLSIYNRKPHRHEIYKINAYLIKTMENLRAFNESFRFYKYSLGIWLMFAKIKHHYTCMITLLDKLRGYLGHLDKNHNISVGICMSIIIKELSLKHAKLAPLAQKASLSFTNPQDGKLFNKKNLSLIAGCTEICHASMFPIENYEQIEFFDVEIYLENFQAADILGSFDESDKSSNRSEERQSFSDLKQSAPDYFNFLMVQEDERLDLVNKILQS